MVLQNVCMLPHHYRHHDPEGDKLISVRTSTPTT